jgi:hypothetical protein
VCGPPGTKSAELFGSALLRLILSDGAQNL